MDRVELAKALHAEWYRLDGDVPLWESEPSDMRADLLRMADKAIELLSPDADLKALRTKLEDMVRGIGVLLEGDVPLTELLDELRFELGRRSSLHDMAVAAHLKEGVRSSSWKSCFKKALEIAKTIGELDQ